MDDRLARVLAHPLRKHVLFEYQGEPACPSDVARRIDRPLNLVSYHTGVLARHGCIELVRTERHRGALTRYYRSVFAQFIDDEGWSRLSVNRRRHLALDTLAQVAGEARQAALSGGFDAPHSHLSRLPVELDARGVAAVSELLRGTFDDIMAIAERSRLRSADRRPYMVVMLRFASALPSGGRASGRAVRASSPHE
jgi:hypothetical protein